MKYIYLLPIRRTLVLNTVIKVLEVGFFFCMRHDSWTLFSVQRGGMEGFVDRIR